MAKRGLLLLNLGTPDSPKPSAVRRYLREFLMDGRVVDLSPLGRWMLVHLIILPTRPRRSAEAYEKIWTPQGSPLLIHSRALAAAVATELKGEFEVALGMRYGNPSTAAAIEDLISRGVTELTVLPLYPQGAASSSGSSIAKVYEVLADRWEPLPVRVIPPFFGDPGFLDSFAGVANAHVTGADHVLFSFHGVPERHVQKSDPTGQHCLATPTCSETLTDANRTCYRAQSFATARELAKRLGLAKEQWSLSFQSRLGRTRWIHPYTDEVIPELVKRGVKKLAVVCPSFVADCLETLEEIGLRGREQFLSLGGEQFTLVPCVNADPAWVAAVARLARSGGNGHA